MEIAEIVKILKTKDSGIDLEQYLLLKLIDKYNIYDFKNEINNLEFKLQQLRINGYIDNNAIPEITEKCIKMFNKAIETSKSKYDFIALHKKLQDELVKLTGKKQKEGFGGTYFIPTVAELEEFLNRFWKKYPKYTNNEKISNILLKHIQKCVKTNSFAPACKYYIIKNGTGSQLANAYENYDEKELEIKQDSQPKDIKNLF